MRWTGVGVDNRILRHINRLGYICQPFTNPVVNKTGYESVETLQADLDAWLVHYNRERPHLGYRNQGRRPWETVQRFVTQEG